MPSRVGRWQRSLKEAGARAGAPDCPIVVRVSDAASDLARWAAALEPQWRAPVQRALVSRDRYLGIVAGLQDGPTKQRLMSLAPTMDHSVQKIADAVWRASNARSIADGLDSAAATAELKQARRDLDAVRAGGGDTAAAQARVDALAQRHRAINDALNLAEDSGSAFDEMNVRLETAVAHAATVALRAGQAPLGSDPAPELEAFVGELSALDAALAELG